LFELNSSDLVALLLGSLAGKPAAGVGVVPQGESGAAGEFAAELLPLLAGEAEAGGPQGAQLQPPRASAQAAVGDWRTLLHSIPADSAQAGQALAKAAVAVEEGPTPTLRERLLLLLEQPELHSAAGKGAPAQRDVESLPPPPDKLPSALLQLLATSLASALEPAAAGELPSVQLLAAVNARLKAASDGLVSLRPAGQDATVPLAQALAGAAGAAASSPTLSGREAVPGGMLPVPAPGPSPWSLVQVVESQGRQFQLWAAPAPTAAAVAVASAAVEALEVQVALVEAGAPSGAFKPLLFGVLRLQPSLPLAATQAAASPLGQPRLQPSRGQPVTAGKTAPMATTAGRSTAPQLRIAAPTQTSVADTPVPLAEEPEPPGMTRTGATAHKPAAGSPPVPEASGQAARSVARPGGTQGGGTRLEASAAASGGEPGARAAAEVESVRRPSAEIPLRGDAVFTELSPILRQFTMAPQRVALPQLAQFIAHQASQAGGAMAPREVTVTVSPPDLGEVVIRFTETAEGLDLLLKPTTAGSSRALREHLPVLAAQLAVLDVPVRNVEVGEAGGQRQGAHHQGQHHAGSGQEQQQPREEARQQHPHQRSPREELEEAMKRAAESARGFFSL